eukprot:INCI4087.2.p1 GENE.INCI4087.2~~INCI4087.2.p1  ORF type:complete len:306 (+),score=40.86 INCI4087.2:212-1129(+)
MPMLGTRRRSRSRKMPLVSFFIAGLLFFLAVATAEGSEASLQLLWSTPFYKSRVKPSALNGKGLAELERLVLQDYAGFRDSVWAADCGGDNVCVADRRKSGALADRPNEKFFQYQREAFEARQANAQGETTGSGGLSSFFGSNGGSLSSRPFSGLPSFGAVDTKSPSVVTALRHEVLEHVQKYLSSLGQSPIDEQDPSFAMFMWATVHNSCVSHLPHVHEVSVCALGDRSMFRTRVPGLIPFFCCCFGAICRTPWFPECFTSQCLQEPVCLKCVRKQPEGPCACTCLIELWVDRTVDGVVARRVF